MNIDKKMISISTDNYIPRSRIIGFLFPGSQPLRKLITEKREQNLLVDATRGRKTRSVILLDNGYIILSSVTPKTLTDKYEEE